MRRAGVKMPDALIALAGLKLETLQPSFSYKIRGAWNAVLTLAERGGAAALVTASAGNHGRALAHAAREVGLPRIAGVEEGERRGGVGDRVQLRQHADGAVLQASPVLRARVRGNREDPQGRMGTAHQQGRREAGRPLALGAAPRAFAYTALGGSRLCVVKQILPALGHHLEPREVETVHQLPGLYPREDSSILSCRCPLGGCRSSRPSPWRTARVPW